MSVSKIRLRVSPRAGATKTRVGAVLFSDSVSSFSVSSFGVVTGVPGLGVPGLAVPGYAPFFPRTPAFGPLGVWLDGGGANLSIVKAKKSSCCSLRCLRMVSKTVEIVRRDECRTDGFSDRASWNRNLQPVSIMRAARDGNSAIRGPDSSNAALRIPSAISRVESVCC